MRASVFAGALLIVLSGCSPQIKEQGFLARGQAQMALKNYARAALQFRNAAQVMPNDAETYYRLGLALLAANQGSIAVPALRKATQLNPKHSGAQLKLAELMVASRRKDLVEKAAKSLQAVLADSPDNAEARDAMALAEMQMGKTEAAAKRLEDTVQKFPRDLNSARDLARLKMAQRDSKAAEEVLQLELARVYLASGQKEKAEAALQKAVELDPKNSAALVDLAAMQISEEHVDDADRTYRQLAALPDKRYRPAHALFLYRTGKQDAAVAELEKLHAADPEDRTVRSLLVRSYLERQQPARALTVLAAALKRNSRDTNALLQKGQIDLQSGQVSQAEQELNHVLEFEPNSAQAHYGLAAAHKIQGSRAIENSELNSALRLNPQMLQARLVLSSNLRDQNQPQAALQVCDEAPRAQKNNLALVVERNWALLATGATAELRAFLDRTLRAQRVPALVVQDGALRLAQHDYAGARADADEALRANPEDLTAARLLIASYSSEGQPEKALARFSELVAGHPKSSELLVLIGQLQMETKRNGEARKSLQAAKDANPSFMEADLALARLDLADRRPDRARQRLQAIVAADPKGVPALLLLADVEDQAGNVAGAIERYRAVLTVDNSNVEALNDLAYLLAGQNPDEALAPAQKAVELAPDNADVQDTLGFVFYRKGDYRQATSYVKAAVAKDPSPGRQFHLAMCYSKSGDQQLASKALAAALKADPNLPKTERGW